MNTIKKHLKKKNCVSFYQNKKMSSFTIQDFLLGHFPKKKTPKNVSPQTPNQPSPDPFPPRFLPTPSLPVSIGFPGPNSLGPTSCQERTFQGWIFQQKMLWNPPKKNNKKSKIHEFEGDFFWFFVRNFQKCFERNSAWHEVASTYPAIHTSLVNSNDPSWTTEMFRWSQGKDGLEQHRRQSRFQPNLLIPQFMFSFCGSKIRDIFLDIKGFHPSTKKKHKKKSLQQILGFRTLISMLGTRLARTSISCSTSAVFGPESTWQCQSSRKNGLHHAKVPKNPTRDCWKNWRPQKGGRRWLWQRAPSLKMIFDGFGGVSLLC